LAVSQRNKKPWLQIGFSSYGFILRDARKSALLRMGSLMVRSAATPRVSNQLAASTGKDL
jgi:hypothetical protein